MVLAVLGATLFPLEPYIVRYIIVVLVCCQSGMILLHLTRYKVISDLVLCSSGVECFGRHTVPSGTIHCQVCNCVVILL